MDRQRVIPSMFHRRLLLIASLMVVVLLLLASQLFRLTVVEGAQRLERAELTLHRRTFLPTYRGSIVDSRGRQLAVDRPGYAIAVRYGVITGAWEVEQARAEARDELGRTRWFSMTREERREAAEARREVWHDKRLRLFEALCTLGEIDEVELQRRFDEIKADVQEMAAAVWARQRAEELARYGGDEEGFYFSNQPIREQTQAHVVLPSVSDAVAFEFRRLLDELPGMFEVLDARRRAYPWSTQSIALDRSTLPRPLRRDGIVEIEVLGVADHILGTMRNQVFREDVERRPFTIRNADGEVIDTDLGGYRIGDRVGNSGLEQVFEDHLRGERGQIRRRLDTDESTRTEPQPGDDLHLTLDVALQARIQAILSHEFGLTVVQPYHRNTVLPDGKPLNAAAVVVEIATGEIRAMVTTPTLADGRAMSEIERSIHRPGYNRAIEAIYPPGSIMKPLVLAAAVTSGVHRLDQPIPCTGHYFPHNEHVARCWIYRDKWGFQTHGELRAEEAIARSCNIFFYTLADRLGIEALLDWYRRFGLGRRLEIGLAERQLDEDGEPIVIGEVAGDLPSAKDLARMRRQGTERFNTIILGIGQGPLTWTPVHAANAYATLARGGTVRDVTLIAELDQPDDRSVHSDLNLDPVAVRAALEGLRQAVSEPHGTGQHITYEPGDQEPIFNARGVTVWGKTGTAQATAADLDGDGTFSESERNLDHAWFVGLVGPDDTNRPMFAISVLVEHGGSGGRCAGPIANQVIHALQEEGYLPRPALAGGGAAR